MKAGQLLERLPKKVIKGGDIVSVRGDVGSLIDNSELPTKVSSERGHAEPTTSSRTGKQVVHLSTRAKIAIQSNIDTSDEIFTSIQVKWHNGKYVFILKMFGSDLVLHIKEAISAYFCDLGENIMPLDFSLRCAYPPRDVADDFTLNEAKLVPSGTLHVKMT